MKIKFLLIAALVCSFAATTVAQDADNDAELRQKINAAVMRVYDEQLQKDPGDYAVLLARAHQLYNFREYGKALIDVNQALGLIPDKESDLRADALMLRARLYDLRQDYKNELNDLKAAYALSPTSLGCVDLLAKLYLKQNDLENAEKNFNTILRNSPMNYDALYGLARVEAKRNNYDKAIELADRAVSFFPAEQEVYLNRADVYNMCGSYQNGAMDYITAMAVSDNQGKAISGLVSMADDHYDAVMAALQDAIDKAPRVGMYYYIRSQIAMNHEHYGQALKNLKVIINNDLFDYHSIFYDAALCQLNLTQYNDAMLNIDKAIAMEPNAPDYYVLKSKIALRQGKGGNYSDAQALLTKALNIDSGHEGALIAAAQLLMAQGKNNDALNALNLATAFAKEPGEALVLRGYLYKHLLKDTQKANADFEAVAKGGDNIENLRGFALYELGRNAEALQWIENIKAADSMTGGEACFCGAALLAAMGENDKACTELE
ncbi:MAG: tetratricopeptide repeat protein, partial [Muribaculaceae bacterium]|nr:tetratricopeptide repeat protein [Muribaculaceae bacterium]